MDSPIWYQQSQSPCRVLFLTPAPSGPEKRHIPHKVVDSGNGVFRIEFTTVEVHSSRDILYPFNSFQVGSYVIDVTVSSLSVPSSPLIAKAYDATLIKVTDISDGVVGDLSTFRGEGGDKDEYKPVDGSGCKQSRRRSARDFYQ